jgi:putative nucleotidyltransferase with HDIG domain
MHELRQAYVGVLEILSKYIESNDRYTMGHSIRVSHLAADTAEQMGLPETRIENCRVAGLLHDIGKVEISMDLIRKASTLTQEEVEVVAAHAQRGARMIDSLGGILREVVTIIEHHHTYFQDRHQREVPQEAYILAVADAYDAIVTDRPYRSGKPPYQAIEELVRGAGTQFSPEVVEAFKRVVARRVEDLESVVPPLYSGRDSGLGMLPDTPAPKQPERSPRRPVPTSPPADSPWPGLASSRQ